MAPIEPTQPTRPEGRPGRPGAGMVLGLRVAMAVLVGALGVALLVAGSVVVGGILLALAGLRLVMTGLMRSRRRQRQAQVAAWRAGRRWVDPAA